MTVHMILGGGMTEPQWAQLAHDVTAYYTAHISSIKFDMVEYHWTDDVYNMIKQSQPTGPLLICGHSYGGHKAIQVAAQFANDNRVVDHIVAFDPVDNNGDNYSRPCAGFALTKNVTEAVAFYRGATEAPFSGKINSGPNFRNVLFPADGSGGSAVHHGDSVWAWQCYGYVQTAVAGQNFLPAVGPTPQPVPSPTPTPTPTPTPMKTVTNTAYVYTNGVITWMTVTYSDGTTASFKPA